MSATVGFLEWTDKAEAYARVPLEHRIAGSNGISLFRVDQPAGSYARPRADEFALQILLNQGWRARVDHGSVFACKPDRSMLALAPADTPLAYEVDGELQVIAVHLPRVWTRNVIHARARQFWSGDFGPLHERLFDDPAVRTLTMRLWQEAAEGSPHGSLFADSAIETLILALLTSAGASLPALASRGGLAPWQVRRVSECIAEHLAEDVSLTALANLVDLSPNHFCTAFRVSFGEPPHRYLIRRRIERAKEMLCDPRVSITDVALAVGFGSSAHFATAFRKQVGVTPTAYRRERLL